MPVIEIDAATLRTLLMWTAVIEARDPYTGGHLWRTGQYVRQLALAAGLSSDEAFVAHLGAFVHDIGKLGVPDSILKKKGRLTEGEKDVMRRHPMLGRMLISGHPLEPLVIDVVAGHHERFDGAGYPQHTQAEAIPLYSRMVSIADTFDAITSVRSYKKDSDLPLALQVLRDESGHQFDPHLANLFVQLGEQGALDHINGHAGENRRMLSCPKCGPVIAPPQEAGSGDEVTCPDCTARYVLHSSQGTFELEFSGHFDPDFILQPDLDEVERFMKSVPARLRL